MYFFLDVDGVLNRESDWRKPFTINPICLHNLKSLVDVDKDVHIILSSTWRQGVSNRGTKFTCPEELMKGFEELGLVIEGTTPVSDKSRQDEIEYYIRRNGVKEYLVLDDDESLFPRPKEINLYLTDYKKGLTKQDVEKIVKRMRRMMTH